MKDIMINGRYRVERKIGQGGFGVVYAGTDTMNTEEVAIKLTNDEEYQGLLESEAEIYEMLSGAIGVPRLLWAGKDGEFDIMVQDLLGPSLEDLFCYCGRRFSLKTTLLIADQAVSRVQLVHDRGLLHRDIKPENFLMGRRTQGNRLYMIDFGLAKELSRAEAARQHGVGDRKFAGSCLFATINNHCGREQSRADDLEALGYMLLYLVNGSLPWEAIINNAATGSSDGQNNMAKQAKLSISVEELCDGLPKEFVTYLKYTRSLGFEGGRPNYSYLRGLFRRAFYAQGFKYDHIFDWTQKLYQEMQSQSDGESDA